MKDIKKKFKTIDCLINNAGISLFKQIQDTTITDYENIINTNLKSVIFMTKHVSKMMISDQYGRIINISSMWGTSGASCEVAYSATKAGVNGLTKALAKELAPSNIQVNAVACGIIDTDMNLHLSEEERIAFANDIPASRFGDAQEIADVVYQLADSPSYLTGQIIGVDGGYL